MRSASASCEEKRLSYAPPRAPGTDLQQISTFRPPRDYEARAKLSAFFLLLKMEPERVRRSASAKRHTPTARLERLEQQLALRGLARACAIASNYFGGDASCLGARQTAIRPDKISVRREDKLRRWGIAVNALEHDECAALSRQPAGHSSVRTNTTHSLKLCG